MMLTRISPIDRVDWALHGSLLKVLSVSQQRVAPTEAFLLSLHILLRIQQQGKICDTYLTTRGHSHKKELLDTSFRTKNAAVIKLTAPNIPHMSTKHLSLKHWISY